jgi:hypothetical protein
MTAQLKICKICKKCKILQTVDQFYLRSATSDKRRATCISCLKQYSEENKKSIKERQNLYYKNNRSYILTKVKNYSDNNKEKIKVYNQTDFRKEKQRMQRRTDKSRQQQKIWCKNNRAKLNARQNKKRKTNPTCRLHHIISNTINRSIKRTGNKKSSSFTKHILYTIAELKLHIEKQFESWMNWDNHGKYTTDTWDDNDPTTWTWQLDHIIPRSELPYTSMEDDNFKKCWALENLRPLSAKQNLLDGTRRVRHNKC